MSVTTPPTSTGCPSAAWSPRSWRSGRRITCGQWSWERRRPGERQQHRRGSPPCGRAYPEAGRSSVALSRVSWRGALQQAVAASTHDAGARLSRIQAPTLVMHGERDRLLPVENAKVLTRLVPGAQLRLLRQAGHFYPITTTAEAARIALAWMAQHADAQPVLRGAGQQLGDFAQDVLLSPVRWTRAQMMPLRHIYRTFRRS